MKTLTLKKKTGEVKKKSYKITQQAKCILFEISICIIIMARFF